MNTDSNRRERRERKGGFRSSFSALFALFAVRKPKLINLQFLRWDGKAVDVKSCACGTCRNYFFVQHYEIEPPVFCPYCGIKFQQRRTVTLDEMTDMQTGFE